MRPAFSFKRRPWRRSAELHDLFRAQKSCMIILTNSDNGEYAFKPLLEKLFGDSGQRPSGMGGLPALML